MGIIKVGQFLLENWLFSYESKKLSNYFLSKYDDFLIDGGQIVLHSTYMKKREENYKFKKINIIYNKGKNRPYFPFPQIYKIQKDMLSKDNNTIINVPMTDISLIIKLTRDDIRKFAKNINDKIKFLENQYWDKQSNIGSHITLYEFAMHDICDKNMLDNAMKNYNIIYDYLKSKIMEFGIVNLSIGGYEMFSKSISLYIELPIKFLEKIEKICTDSIKENEIINLKRTPFPLHCTLLRFKEDIVGDRYYEIKKFIEENRNYVHQKEIKKLSLVLATKKPYSDVYNNCDKEILLQS